MPLRTGKPLKSQELKRSLTQLSERALLPLIAISAVVLLVIIATFVLFAVQSWHSLLKFSQPRSVTKWGAFGSLVGSMLQAFVSALALFAAAVATWVLSANSEERRLNDQQTHAAVRLSETMKDKDFYIKVVAPSWEIASKWMFWRGPEGDKYRLDVCAGMFSTHSDGEWDFTTPSQASEISYQNVIRFIPHYQPYDWNAGGQTISELSEHMVLMIWVSFWDHVYWLHQEDQITSHMIRSLFKDWYRSWRPFMMQLRLVGDVLNASSAFNPEARGDREHPVPQLAFSQRMSALEKILYLEGDNNPDPGEVDSYQALEVQAKLKAEAIAEAVLALHGIA